MTNRWNFDSNELSTLFNMMIVKKFTKDVQDLGTNKIFKRNFFMIYINKKRTNFVEVVAEKAKITIKEAKPLEKHPAIVAEAKDGCIIIGNLTSSEKKIEGEKPVWVGKNFKTGKDIRLVNNKLYIIHNEEAKDIKLNLRSSEVTNFNLNNNEPLDKLAYNIGNEIEAVTGKELKNKNYESISLLKKTTIEKI